MQVGREKTLTKLLESDLNFQIIANWVRVLDFYQDGESITILYILFHTHITIQACINQIVCKLYVVLDT